MRKLHLIPVALLVVPLASQTLAALMTTRRRNCRCVGQRWFSGQGRHRRSGAAGKGGRLAPAVRRRHGRQGGAGGASGASGAGGKGGSAGTVCRW